MNILKKIFIFSSAFLIILSLFSCSWADVTVTPDGTPIVNPDGNGDGDIESLTSNGTYGLTYNEGLDFYAVTGYHGTEADVFIPAELNGKPVTCINSYAFFENSTVETITITSAIKSVGKNALVGNYKVFCETDDPHECTITEGCNSIHPDGWHSDWYINSDGERMSADKEKVEWACGSFGSFSWETNKDDDIVITGYIESPKNLTIPEKIGKRTVVSIAKGAFDGCKSLETISLPDTIEEIGSFAFRACESLKSITIPESVTVISSYLFDGCKVLETIKISTKTTSIGDSAFANCANLKRIDIPNTVKNVGLGAFYKDTDLKIYLWGFDSVPDEWNDNWNRDGGEIIYEQINQ